MADAMEYTMERENEMMTSRQIMYTAKQKIYQMYRNVSEMKEEENLRRLVLLKAVLRFGREQRKRKFTDDEQCLPIKK